MLEDREERKITANESLLFGTADDLASAFVCLNLVAFYSSFPSFSIVKSFDCKKKASRLDICQMQSQSKIFLVVVLFINNGHRALSLLFVFLFLRVANRSSCSLPYIYFRLNFLIPHPSPLPLLMQSPTRLECRFL